MAECSPSVGVAAVGCCCWKLSKRLLFFDASMETRIDLCELVAVSCWRALYTDTLPRPAAQSEWPMLLLFLPPAAAQLLLSVMIVVSVHPHYQ